MFESFDNYLDFANKYPDIASELLDQVGDGDWQYSNIYYYPTLSDFAEYELTEGWYIDLGLSHMDFRGAPNPIDYIDLDAFGSALTDTGDESMQWTDGNCVVTTDCGW